MKANAIDVLTTKIYFQAAFPALRVALEEDPKQVKAFKDINGVVEFRVIDDENPLSCYMVFLTDKEAKKTKEERRFKVYQGNYPGYIEMKDGSKKEDLKVCKMYFKSIKSLLGVFKGNSPLEMLGIFAPLIKNAFNPITFKFLFLMLMLTKTMPNFVPTDSNPWEQYIKVKLSLVLITRALSVANKENWEPMKEWTSIQPDRTYQFIVGETKDCNGNVIYPRITANLRVKNGMTKSSKGCVDYPFVLFNFPNPDSCIAVLTNRYGFVECVARGCVSIIGAGDSYAVGFNAIMTKCQNMLVPSKLVQ